MLSGNSFFNFDNNLKLSLIGFRLRVTSKMFKEYSSLEIFEKNNYFLKNLNKNLRKEYSNILVMPLRVLFFLNSIVLIIFFILEYHCIHNFNYFCKIFLYLRLHDLADFHSCYKKKVELMSHLKLRWH